MSHPLVVHCRKESYNVYVGRGRCPQTGSWGEWGNPFIVGIHGTREECVEAYRLYLSVNPQLINKIKGELKGKRLGCWCAPKSCHGDVIAEIANIE